jgi:AbrB family looped-hinge helix DNA binding protein
VRVTSKGQVTIPLAVRRRLGITPGAEVDITFADDHAEIWKAADDESDEIARMIDGMRGALGPGPTTDEILLLTRGED